MHPYLYLFGHKLISYDLLELAGLAAAALYFYTSPAFKDLRWHEIAVAAVLAYFVQYFGAMLIPFVYRMVYLHQQPWLDVFSRPPGRYFHSAVLPSIAFWWIWGASKKRAVRPIMDQLAIAILIASAIGRIGCWMQGCCGGQPCNLPWAVKFPNQPVTTHPTQMYMFIAETLMALGFWLFDRKKKEYDSQTFWYAVYAYSVYRFLIEFVRVNPPFVAGLSHAQVFSVVTWGIAQFMLFFHRNPKRLITQNPKQILSAADGTIVAIGAEAPIAFDNKPWVCVSIFLSPMDVHINRTPVAGRIDEVFYKPGGFKPATDVKNFSLNESCWMLISNPGFKCVVRQIAGLLGRKIVCQAKKGDKIEQGQVYGRILLGSGTQVFFPSNFTVKVKLGDKVKAGQTVLAEIK